MSKMFRLALIQMRIVGGRPTENIANALAYIAQAANAGAQVVLLPEAFTLGWTDPSAHTLAEPIPDGPSCQTLRSAAARHGVYLCTGFVERDGASTYNTALLINPSGDIILQYRKIHELGIGQELYAPGDRLGIAATAYGTFGVMICADAFAGKQVISRTLGFMGADVILSPSAWAVPADYDNVKTPYGGLWREHYSTVARDFQLWIAGVSNVGWITDGPWAGRQCIGCSLVVGPDGEVVTQGPYGVDAQTILYVDIAPTPRPAQGTEWTALWSTHNGTRQTVSGTGV